MKVTNDIIYVGVNDHQTDLFEGQYAVPNGMAYNSYVIIDEKVAVVDTVDVKFTHEWLDNVGAALGGAKPDYLIIQHMEPDHSANIYNFMKIYPDTTIVGNAKTFTMIANFFRDMDLDEKKLEVKNGDTLTLAFLICVYPLKTATALLSSAYKIPQAIEVSKASSNPNSIFQSRSFTSSLEMILRI